MFDPEVVESLKERYAYLPPLLVHLSIEWAKTMGELFDILDGCPQTLPVAWDEQDRRWNTTDLLQSRKP